MPKVSRSSVRKGRVPYAKGFRPPTPRQQKQALLGEKPETEVPVEFRDAHSLFPRIPHCTSIDDWLAQYKEDGQTYQGFLTECPWLSTRRRKFMTQAFNPNGFTLPEKYPSGTIYILPLGDFSDAKTDKKETCVPDIDTLVDYASRFLCLPVKKLPVVEIIQQNDKLFWVHEHQSSNNNTDNRATLLKSRYNAKTGRIQLCVDHGLLQLRKQQMPANAICIIALTMFDLYQDAPDLFVAGLASGNQRAAIFSFCRYDPNLTFSKEFWYDIASGCHVAEEDRRRLVLQRSCRLLAHEINHLLGIDHCIFYACSMNGSGHLEEDFGQPMFLCPVDLRKLHRLSGFDVIERYRGLLDFYQRHSMGDEASWIRKRLDQISGATLK